MGCCMAFFERNGSIVSPIFLKYVHCARGSLASLLGSVPAVSEEDWKASFAVLECFGGVTHCLPTANASFLLFLYLEQW